MAPLKTGTLPQLGRAEEIEVVKSLFSGMEQPSPRLCSALRIELNLSSSSEFYKR